MKQKGFYPTEIIFSATNACNLHCEHCFIERNPHKLSIDDAVAFLENCVASAGKTYTINKRDSQVKTNSKEGSLPVIEKIGFSGGEPFLFLDFLTALTKTAVSHDLLFDQIMTNGDWWHEEADLRQTLQTLYDAGYDGKIGLSLDAYHGQSAERMKTFIRVVQEIFGADAVNIQAVDEESSRNEFRMTETVGITETEGVTTYHLPRTYTSDDPRGWKAKHWFKEDYCQGPGNILYIHADGNIAPCCGFANENHSLFIGTIKDSLEQIMQNAASNKIVQLCFEKGLSHERRKIKKQLRSQHKKLPGKTSDICTFCDYVCKLKQ